MFEIRLLGRIEVDLGDRSGADALLTQPKVVALLAFLAADRPHGMKRRDTLLPLLWPEFDDKRARQAYAKHCTNCAGRFMTGWW